MKSRGEVGRGFWLSMIEVYWMDRESLVNTEQLPAESFKNGRVKGPTNMKIGNTQAAQELRRITTPRQLKLIKQKYRICYGILRIRRKVCERTVFPIHGLNSGRTGHIDV
jgi:hypothetical protein